MTLTSVLLSETEATYTLTERLFRRVNDDQLHWRPSTGSNWMTVGQLLMHCGRFGCGRAIEGFVTGSWEGAAEDSTADEHMPAAESLPTVTTVAEAIELLAVDRELALSCIREAGEAALRERSAVAPWGGPPMPLFQQLLRMIAHLAQHKGQLFYYLKLMGQEVSTEDLWGA